MSNNLKYSSLQRIAYDNNNELSSDRSNLVQPNYNSYQIEGNSNNNRQKTGININQKNFNTQSQSTFISNAQLKNSEYNTIENSNKMYQQYDQLKSIQKQSICTNRQNVDSSSSCSQSQIQIDKVKLFEKISYSIDQLSENVMDYLNANIIQTKQNIQIDTKSYNKQEINYIKNLLHATIGNFLVETVKFDDPLNKENQKANNNNQNGFSYLQSNHEFDDMLTHLPTSKNTFTNRPNSNSRSGFFTEYQPEEYALHQEIEKLNDIINQMQSEKEWLQNQIQDLQYEDIISLKQERQTFEEIKGDLADYIQNFKKNFLCTQLNCQKASDIVQSDLFNEFYDILTTTENNWKVSKFSKKINNNFKDDMKLYNLVWKQKRQQQIGSYIVELRKRSRSFDFKNEQKQNKVNNKQNILSTLNEQVVEQQQKIKQTNAEKEIEFSIFHTFLRQFTQNTINETIDNKAFIQEQQEVIQKQQDIINEIQGVQYQNFKQNGLKNEQDMNWQQQELKKQQFNNYQVYDENGDSPMFSKLRNAKSIQSINVDSEAQDLKEGFKNENDYQKQNNYRKSNDQNSLKRIGGDQIENDKVLFTLNNEEDQFGEENGNGNENFEQENKSKKNKQLRSINQLMDLPLQIQNVKQSENNFGGTAGISHQMNIQTQNMNFTIGNDQSDFLLQNIQNADPSFNQEINISCINKLEDEPQQIINFLETLEQKPTSRFMCQSSFKKQKIVNLLPNKQNQGGSSEEDQFNEIGDEFIHLDQIQLNNRNGINQELFKQSNRNLQNVEPNINIYNQRNGQINQYHNKKHVQMSFNNKEDLINNLHKDQEQQEYEVEKSKIESFMNENFDDVNNSLNLEDIEQIEELCDPNRDQQTNQKQIKHLKNIDLPKLDLSTINCTEQLKNMRMTIGQQFMNNQSLQQALQISSCKSQANQFTNPQALFNLISPIHNLQQNNNRQQNFQSKRNNLPSQQNVENQNNYQQQNNIQGIKLNDSILNQTQNNHNNTQLELLKGLNDTVLNQMEKIEIERSNFYQNYQNLLNEKNEILQREIVLKNTIIDLQREIQFFSEENCRLRTEIEQSQKYIEQEMDIIKRENENINTKKEKLRQSKEQLEQKKKQQEDKEKIVGQQQLMNMLQEKKIIFQKQTLDQQWSEWDKKKADIERQEKLLNEEWENVKKETKKIKEFISKQKLIKENHQKEIQQDKQAIQQQKDEIKIQYKKIKQMENDLNDLENEFKVTEKKREENMQNQLKIIKQKEDQLKEKENMLKEKEKKKEEIQKNQMKEIEEKYNILHEKEQEMKEREQQSKATLKEALSKKSKYTEDLKRLKDYEDILSQKEQNVTQIKYELMSDKLKLTEKQDKINQDMQKYKGMIPNLKSLTNKMSDYEDNTRDKVFSSHAQGSKSGSLSRLKKY